MRKGLDVARGHAISAREWNRIVAEVERLGRITAEPPLEVVNQFGGVNLRLSRGEFWAILQAPVPTGETCLGLPYKWAEVMPKGDGTWVLLTAGRSGTTTVNPGYERNGACVSVGTIVRMKPGLNNEYIFDQSAVGTVPGCGVECGSPVTCINYVEDVTCLGGTLVVTKNSLVWTPYGWEICSGCCSGYGSSGSVSGGGGGGGGGNSITRQAINAWDGITDVESPVFTTENITVQGLLIVNFANIDGVVLGISFNGTPMIEAVSVDINSVNVGQYYLNVPTSTTGAITVTNNELDYFTLFDAVEVVGLTNNTPDATQTGNGAGSSPIVGTRTNLSNEYAQAMFILETDTVGTWGGGFTSGDDDITDNNGNNWTLTEGYMVVPTSGTTIDATLTGAVSHWYGCIVTYS